MTDRSPMQPSSHRRNISQTLQPSSTSGVNISALDSVTQALYTGTGETSVDHTQCPSCSEALPPYHYAPIEPWSEGTFSPSMCCVTCRLHDRIFHGAIALKGDDDGRELDATERDGLRGQQLRAIHCWHSSLFRHRGIFVPHATVVAVSTSVIEHALLLPPRQETPPRLDPPQPPNSPTANSPRQEPPSTPKLQTQKVKARGPRPRSSSNASHINSSPPLYSGVPQPGVRAAAEKARRSVQWARAVSDEDDLTRPEPSVAQEVCDILAAQRALYDRALGHIVRAQDEHEALRREHLNDEDMYHGEKWAMVNSVSREQAHTKIVIEQMRGNLERAVQLLVPVSTAAASPTKKKKKKK